jgi:hypothetical protein
MQLRDILEKIARQGDLAQYINQSSIENTLPGIMVKIESTVKKFQRTIKISKDSTNDFHTEKKVVEATTIHLQLDNQF